VLKYELFRYDIVVAAYAASTIS